MSTKFFVSLLITIILTSAKPEVKVFTKDGNLRIEGTYKSNESEEPDGKLWRLQQQLGSKLQFEKIINFKMRKNSATGIFINFRNNGQWLKYTFMGEFGPDENQKKKYLKFEQQGVFHTKIRNMNEEGIITLIKQGRIAIEDKKIPGIFYPLYSWPTMLKRISVNIIYWLNIQLYTSFHMYS